MTESAPGRQVLPGLPPPPWLEPASSRKPPRPPVLGWVGLRAGRHLPPSGVESRYHLPGQSDRRLLWGSGLKPLIDFSPGVQGGERVQ